ncbi:MAG: hypothetical protein KDA57_17790 [Planctomycetales bacterium]|nr:hypothetical protein [Planctomycetales bacterium]
MADEKKSERLVAVTFVKQWRGHAKGDEVLLKPERAKQLIAEKVCEAGTKAVDKSPAERTAPRNRS